MTIPTAIESAPAPAVAAAAATCVHVFGAEGGARPDREVVEVARLVDPAFLSEAGWDPAARVLFPPPDHRLLGRPVCTAPGCAVTAPHRCRICTGCQRRLAQRGLGADQIELLPAREGRDGGIGGCVVTGCARQWASGRARLCRHHLDQRQSLGLGMAEFLAHPQTRALRAYRPCEVASCPRQRRHRDGQYCDAHQLRLRATRRRDSGLDEGLWRRTEPPIGAGGQVSLRGLPALVVAQVLLGLQQRCRLDQVRTKEADLRSVCDDLRRQQVTTIGDYQLAATRSLAFAGLVNSLTKHVRRALTSPALEATGNEWDLAVFGHTGTLSFTVISQHWLREAAKRWAIDDLPRRRIRRGRRTSAGLSVRHHVNALARLSESLRPRADRGENPAGLGRADIESFLNRLSYLVADHQISLDARIRTVREVRHVLATSARWG